MNWQVNLQALLLFPLNWLGVLSSLYVSYSHIFPFPIFPKTFTITSSSCHLPITIMHHPTTTSRRPITIHSHHITTSPRHITTVILLSSCRHHRIFATTTLLFSYHHQYCFLGQPNHLPCQHRWSATQLVADTIPVCPFWYYSSSWA